jgi:hypothetical protein
MEVLTAKVQKLTKDGSNPVLKEQFDLYELYVKKINDTYSDIIKLTKQVNVAQFKTVSENDQNKVNTMLKSMAEYVGDAEKTGMEISRLILRISGDGVSEITMKLALEMRQFLRDVENYTKQTRTATTIQSVLALQSLQERLAALKMGGGLTRRTTNKRRKMKASTRKVRKAGKTRKERKHRKGSKTCRH